MCQYVVSPGSIILSYTSPVQFSEFVKCLVSLGLHFAVNWQDGYIGEKPEKKGNAISEHTKELVTEPEWLETSNWRHVTHDL